ncbi:DUF397 domain-containing protein [Streptomyces fradiae]|nr:DUF397 domain-containing protein [Streptomyces fradiae]WOI63804.1 DUF397 domain-containing protein [Streptomyces fradiae]
MGGCSTARPRSAPCRRSDPPGLTPGSAPPRPSCPARPRAGPPPTGSPVPRRSAAPGRPPRRRAAVRRRAAGRARSGCRPVHVRDSKDTSRAALSVAAPAWSLFVGFAAQ